MTPNFIQEAIFSFAEAMNLVKIPNTEEEYKRYATPYPDKKITKTWEEVVSKSNELKAEYDSKSYARARQTQYPSITDVVVALAEKEEGDDTMWQHMTALRKKVKSDNPKP